MTSSMLTWRDRRLSFDIIGINYGINRTIPYGTSAQTTRRPRLRSILILVSANITGNKQWIISFAVQLIPGGMLAVSAVLLTESPRWRELYESGSNLYDDRLTRSPSFSVASKNRREQALKNLAFIRNLPADHPYVREEMEEIEVSHERDQLAGGAGFMGPIRTLFRSRMYLKRVGIAVSLFAMQNGTGINAINYVSLARDPSRRTTVLMLCCFDSTRLESLLLSESLVPTLLCSPPVSCKHIVTTKRFSERAHSRHRRPFCSGLIKFAGAVVWLLYLVDRFGRKPLLIVGAAGGAVSMYYIGAYIAIAKPENNAPGTKLSSGGISAIAFFYIWTCFYGPTWNGTPWVFGAEVMPTFVRSATQAM